MISRCQWALLGVALVMTGNLFGQEKTEKSVSAPKPEPDTVEVRFADDSTVKMVLQHSSIEVATRYGKLSVPVAEMRRIDFGLRIPDETAKRIDIAIGKLGSVEFKQRDAASAELLQLRELAFPALQRAAKSEDLEVAKRAKDAIKTLVENMPPEKLYLARHDTVVTMDFTIVGQVETSVLKVRTPYFGETSLKLSEVRSMRWLANDREATIAIDAGKYGGPQESWLDTNIEVRSGTPLQVTATGLVDLRPLPGEAGTYMVGPDGQNQRMNMNQFQGGFQPAVAGRRGAARDSISAYSAESFQ
jgi:hypothetical protein